MSLSFFHEEINERNFERKNIILLFIFEIKLKNIFHRIKNNKISIYDFVYLLINYKNNYFL
jgi:hypothetical protein